MSGLTDSATWMGVLRGVTNAEQQQIELRLGEVARLAALGRLAAAIAHEINDPVNTIINSAQLVQDGDASVDHCRTIIEEGSRLAEIAKDLLDFALNDQDGPSVASVAQTARRTLRLTAENLKCHGIALRAIVPDDLPRVRIRPQQLLQVLLNLVINAKESLLGSKAPHDRPCIELVARLGDDGLRPVQVAVRDNGPGIAPKVRHRLFDPFLTTKGALGNPGLGLALTRSLVEHYGGSVEFDSVPWESTEFRVSLRTCDEET